ncbi:MAG TPA: signal peptidase I [Acidimicrobiia bacterium]|nr:signal peptidase I [Acidimicrobiia bacterium]
MDPFPKAGDPSQWGPGGSTVEQTLPVQDDEPPASPPPSKRKAAWLSALEWGILVISALAIALLIKTFLFQAFYIPSESMTPTLQKDDRVLVNKLSYDMHAVHRGDIVVFKAPPDIDPSVKDLVKRVIGLPGETIEARGDGRVYINGSPLDERWLPAGVRTDPGFTPIKVPPDSYYVLGDNRQNSKDSRYFPSHFIRKKDIVGRVFVRIWPLNRLGIL